MKNPFLKYSGWMARIMLKTGKPELVGGFSG